MGVAPLFCRLFSNYCSLSSYDSIRSRQHIRRDRQADLFCRFRIDDEIKLRRPLHGQFRRLWSLLGFYLRKLRLGGTV